MNIPNQLKTTEKKGLRCSIGLHDYRKIKYVLEGREFHGMKPHSKKDIGVEWKCSRCGGGHFYIEGGP